jgi:hypothetical protein
MSTLSFSADTRLGCSSGTGCPLSCKDIPEPLLCFGDPAGECNLEASGREWCNAVSGLDPDERKYLTQLEHSGQVVTYGYNTNHQVTNVRVHGTGTIIFWSADEDEKTT